MVVAVVVLGVIVVVVVDVVVALLCCCFCYIICDVAINTTIKTTIIVADFILYSESSLKYFSFNMEKHVHTCAVHHFPLCF